jgi:hypothetical protein
MLQYRIRSTPSKETKTMSDSYQHLDGAVLNDLIAQRRRNLQRLEEQAAGYGSGQEPLALYNQLQNERREFELLLAEQQRRSAPGSPDSPVIVERQLVQEVQAQMPSIGAGLAALLELLRLPGVRAAVVAFRTDFEAAREQIGLLSRYKMIHDLFQQLEDCHDLLYYAGKRLPADEMAWEDLERNEPELQYICDELLDIAGRSPFAAAEALWMRRLDRARKDLRAAIDGGDVAQLKKATSRINDEVLGRELSRINSSLVSAARTLRLAALAQALTTVSGSLTGLKLEAQALRQFEVFGLGVAALGQLDARLSVAVNHHDALQAIDDELRRIKDLLDQDVDELELAWGDLQPMMQALCVDNRADWAVKLGENGAALEQVLSAADPVRVRRVFLRYRSHVSRSFNQVDRDLLTMCEELQKVGAPLNAVLRVMAGAGE